MRNPPRPSPLSCPQRPRRLRSSHDRRPERVTPRRRVLCRQLVPPHHPYERQTRSHSQSRTFNLRLPRPRSTSTTRRSSQLLDRPSLLLQRLQMESAPLLLQLKSLQSLGHSVNESSLGAPRIKLSLQFLSWLSRVHTCRVLSRKS